MFPIDSDVDEFFDALYFFLFSPFLNTLLLILVYIFFVNKCFVLKMRVYHYELYDIDD